MSDILVKKLVAALTAAKAHLEYCGYGDKWERECARDDKLADKIEDALNAANYSTALDGVIQMLPKPNKKP